MTVVPERQTHLEVPSWEASVKAALSDLEPLVEKLRLKGKIPVGARIAPLSALSCLQRERLLELHEEFSSPREVARLRLAGLAPSDNYCQQKSSVLLLVDEVVGAFLVQLELNPASVFVYGVVVSKSRRHTWASPLLKYASLVRLREAKIACLHFQAMGSGRLDTRRNAERVGATPWRPE